VSVGIFGYRLASADFNGDQNEDLASWDGQTLHVAYGDGLGNFNAPMTMEAKSIGLTMGLSAGDVDNDGINEVLLFDGTAGSVMVCTASNGTVTDIATFNLEEQTLSLTVADLNADGFDDLIAGVLVVSDSMTTGGVHTYIGSPDGFSSAGEVTLLPNCYASAMASLHLNQDDRLDIAVLGGCAANFDQSPFNLLTLSQESNYQPFAEYIAGEDPQSIAAVRVNSDDADDLVVANRGSNDLSVFLGNGNGTFGDEQRMPLACEACATLVYVGGVDLDNDGTEEILYISGTDSGSVLRAKYKLGEEVELGSAWSEFRVADFNEDGRGDIAFPSSIDGQVHVLLSSGE